MVFSIMCALTVVVMVVVVIVQNRFGKMSWAETLADAAGVLAAGAFLGGIVLVFSAAISSFMIHPDKGWELQSETTYTVAETSNIVADGDSIEFVGTKDGKLENVKLYISGDVVYAEDSEAAQTVVVREEFRELGTAIFPWGVGDFKTTATIK